MNMKVPEHRSEMKANIWVIVMYIITAILGFISGVAFIAWAFPLIFYFLERYSEFVRFYALQAVVLYALCAIIQIVLGIVSLVVSFAMASSFLSSFSIYGASSAAVGLVVISAISIAISVVAAIFAIIAMVKAYRFEEYEIPLVGKLARKWFKPIKQ
ncbi:MAG: hypothetical protein ACOYJB_02465 [Christensenellaceae bacterium]